MEGSEYGAKNMKAPSCPASIAHSGPLGCGQMRNAANKPTVTEKGQSRFWPQFIYYFGQVKENCPLKSIVKTALCMCEKKKFNYFS